MEGEQIDKITAEQGVPFSSWHGHSASVPYHVQEIAAHVEGKNGITFH